jgi:hypothetical protein
MHLAAILAAYVMSGRWVRRAKHTQLDCAWDLDFHFNLHRTAFASDSVSVAKVAVPELRRVRAFGSRHRTL